MQTLPNWIWDMQSDIMNDFANRKYIQYLHIEELLIYKISCTSYGEIKKAFSI